jgi:hypothetical protein
MAAALITSSPVHYPLGVEKGEGNFDDLKFLKTIPSASKNPQMPAGVILGHPVYRIYNYMSRHDSLIFIVPHEFWTGKLHCQ